MLKKDFFFLGNCRLRRDGSRFYCPAIDPVIDGANAADVERGDF